MCIFRILSLFPKSLGIVSEVGTPTRVNGLAVRGGDGNIMGISRNEWVFVWKSRSFLGRRKLDHEKISSHEKRKKHLSPIGGFRIEDPSRVCEGMQLFGTVGYSILFVLICHATAFTWCIILGDVPPPTCFFFHKRRMEHISRTPLLNSDDYEWS